MFCSQLVCNFYSWHNASMSIQGTLRNLNVRYFLYKAVSCSSSASVLSFPHGACASALRNSHSHVLWYFSEIETLKFPSEQSNTIRESSKLIICCLKHLSISLENYLTVFNLWSAVCGASSVCGSQQPWAGVCANFHQWGASLGLQSQSEARRGSSLPGLERVQCPAKLKRIVRAVGSLLELREGRDMGDKIDIQRVWTFPGCKDKSLQSWQWSHAFTFFSQIKQQ